MIGGTAGWNEVRGNLMQIVVSQYEVYHGVYIEPNGIGNIWVYTSAIKPLFDAANLVA